MLRKLLLAALALVVVLVVAVDRVGEHVAAHVLAGKLESDEHLDSRPSVSIDGIPFLTQAFGGSYHEVTVTTRNFLTPDRVRLETLTVHLRGVHIPFSKVVDGSVSTVPVDHVEGTVFVSFAEITRYLLGRGISATLTRGSAGAVDVQVRLTPRSKLLTGVAKLGVSGTTVTLSLAPSSAVRTPVVLRVPIEGLPFRFGITSVVVGADGITGTGTASHVVLGS